MNHRLLTLVVASLLSLALAWPAHGQAALGGVDDLPAKDQLVQTDRERIGNWVNALRTGLTGTPEQISQSRNALLAPLNPSAGRRVSVAFRVEVGTSLLPIITPLTKDTRDIVAINALRLAGELATANSLQVALDALGDSRPSVRYAAAFAVGRSFDAVGRFDPAVLPQQINQAIDRLTEFASKETDPGVADGTLIALSSGVGISNARVKEQFQNTRSKALIGVARLGRVFAERLGKAEQPEAGAANAAPSADAWLPLVVRATTIGRAALTERNRQGQIDLTPEATTEIAGLAGDVASAVARVLKQPSRPPSGSLEQAAAAAQASLSVIVGERLGRAEDFQLAKAANAGDAALAKTEADRIIAKLVAEPFKLAPDRFKF